MLKIALPLLIIFSLVYIVHFIKKAKKKQKEVLIYCKQNSTADDSTIGYQIYLDNLKKMYRNDKL